MAFAVRLKSIRLKAFAFPIVLIFSFSHFSFGEDLGNHSNENYTKSNLDQEPSTNTTPVFFTVDGVSYKVPRNYIFHMFNWNENLQKDGSPLLKVTFPGFEPLTDKTKDCLLSHSNREQHECMSLAFSIGGKPQILQDEKAKIHEIFLNPKEPSLIKKGPYDYSFIEMKISKNKLYRIYFKEADGQSIYFKCLLSTNDTNVIDQIKSSCRKDSLTSKGSVFEYLFSLDKLSFLERVNPQLEILVNSFTVSGAKS